MFFHDTSAPPATVVTPSAFVVGAMERRPAAPGAPPGHRLRELPGGRVDVGETAEEAAVRETAEKLASASSSRGSSDCLPIPGTVIRSPGGEVRQQFAVAFRARATDGAPRGDMQETE